MVFLKKLSRFVFMLLLVLSMLPLPITSFAEVALAAPGDWMKYSGVSLGGQKYVIDSYVMKDGSTYKMWFTYVNTSQSPTWYGGQLAQLHATNLITALENNSASAFFASLSALAAAGDQTAIWNVINSATGNIGYADSTDGKNWTVRTPVVAVGPGAGLFNSVGMPTVYKDTVAGNYKMWYTRVVSTLNQTQLTNILNGLATVDPPPTSTTTRRAAIETLLNSTYTVIEYRTSPNGYDTWSPAATALAPTGATWNLFNSVGSPSVILDSGNTYRMWYTRLRTTYSAANMDAIVAKTMPPPGSVNMDDVMQFLSLTSTAIYYTSSTDPSTFTAGSVSLAPGAALWQSASDPYVVKTASAYEMWYTSITSNLTTSALARPAMTILKNVGWSGLWTSLNTKSFANFLIDIAHISPAALTSQFTGTSSNIGYATTGDGGATWLPQVPDITGASNTPWGMVSAPSVFRSTSGSEMWYTQGFRDLTWDNVQKLALGGVLPIGYASTKQVTSVVVDPRTTPLPKGSTHQFEGTAYYSDSSSQRITSANSATLGITWASSDPTVADISAAGLARGLTVGETNITATCGTVTSTPVKLTIGPPQLLSITVTAPPAFPKGRTGQMQANGTYTDGTIDITSIATWESLNNTIATVNAAGVVTGVAIGGADIRASLSGRSNTASVTIGPPVWDRLVVSPAGPSVARGDDIQFTATEYLSDGAFTIGTATATWTSDNGNVTAVPGTPGKFRVANTATIGGTANISATYNGRTSSTVLTVAAARMIALHITNVSPRAPASTTGTTALNLSTDQSDGTLGTPLASNTPGVTWASLDTSKATVDASGNVTAIAEGTATIRAGYNGFTATVVFTVDKPNLVSVEVLPGSPTVTVTAKVQFSVLGTYTDGSKKLLSLDNRYAVTWSKTAGTGDATITPTGGEATGTLPVIVGTSGTVTITATISNTLGLPAVPAGNTVLTVIAAQLTAIAVTPNPVSVPKGMSQQFTAKGTYNTTPPTTNVDITAQVQWTITGASGVASISASGLATAQAETGSTTINAALGTINGTATLNAAPKQVASIALSPANQSIPNGRQQQYTATATYSDNSTGVITAGLTWSIIAGTGSATNVSGLVTGTGVGDVTVRAIAATGTPGTTTLTITAAVLDEITVTSTTATFTAAGNTLQMVAKGKYSDGTSNVVITNSVAWSSSIPSTASVDSTAAFAGRVSTYVPGSVIISASSQGRTGSLIIRVDPATVSSVSVDPVGAVIAKGTTRTFRAVAVYTDQSSRTVVAADGVVWTTVDVSGGPGVATVVSSGVVTGAAKGTANVRAAFSGQTGQTLVTVTDAALNSVTVTATSYTVPAGKTQAFTAQGFYSDAPLVGVDITGVATWTSDAPSVAGINSAGVATGFIAGSTANIRASYTVGTVTRTSPPVILTVGAPVLERIDVTPASPTVTFISGAVQTLQFRATGVKSNGTTEDLTASAAWTSSVGGVAANPPGGLATILSGGASTTISAGSGGKTGTSVLNVLADTVAPTVTIINPQDGLTTSVRNITVTGTINDVAAPTKQLIVNGVSQTLTTDGAGNFSASVVLSDGTNTLVGRAVDVAGNAGVTSTVTVKVDAQKPSITLTSPAAGLLTNNAAVTVAGTATGVNGVQYAYISLNGATAIRVTVAANGSFSLGVTLLSGKNIICVTAYDKNNEGAPAWLGTSGAREVFLDVTPPVVTVNTPINGAIFSLPGITVAGTVDDPAVTTARLVLNGGAPVSIDVVSGRFSKNVTLAPGQNTISVSATDRAGNLSAYIPVSVTLDTSTPSVTLTSPANNLRTNAGSQRVAGSVTDPSITQVQVYVNGQKVDLPITPVFTGGVFTRGDFSGMVSLNSGANNTIVAQATNNAVPPRTGSSGVINVYVDTVSPVLAVTFTDPTTSVVITVTSDKALTAPPAVTVDTAPVTNVIMTASGVNTWTGNFAIAAPGTFNVSVSGIDVAGNRGSTSGSFTKQTVVSTGAAAVPVKTPAATLQVETLGAVTADVSVSSQVNPSGNAGAPGAAPMAAGAYVDIKAGTQLLNNLKKIYIEVPYDPTKLAGVAESSLKLYVWDVSTGTWQEVAGSGVDTVRRVIFGTIDHLSTYGGFGKSTVTGEGGPGGAVGMPLGIISVFDKVDQVSHKFIDTVVAGSSDGLVIVTMPVNTKAEAANGSALWEVRVIKADPQPTLPAELKGVGFVYNFGLDGATFSPAITVVFPFTQAQLPAGATADKLRVAWKDAQGKWNLLPAADVTVNAAAGKVTAKFTHFTPYTLVVSYAPASFTTTGLKVSPTSVNENESATVSVTVTNSGDLSGDYSVALKVDNAVVQTKTGTLAGGASTVVSFTVTQAKAGSYAIAIGSESATLTVTTLTAARFTTSKLTAAVTSVAVNQSVSMSFNVTNTGNASGGFEVPVKVNGTVTKTQTGTLAAGASQTVTFSLAFDKAGTYLVEVGGESITVTVSAVRPPAFTASGLTVNPATVKAGETAQISVSIKNTGEQPGPYTVTLKVNGTTEATQTVTVAAGVTQIVSFTLGKAQAGTYAIDVNGQAGSLIVQAVPVPPTTQPPPVKPVRKVPTWVWIAIGVVAGFAVVVFVLAVIRRSRGSGR